jgi:hypothetical protein
MPRHGARLLHLTVRSKATRRAGGQLATRAATIELPAVFEQSAIVLATLEAKADWTVREGEVDVRLRKASFDNADAAGEASGVIAATARARRDRLSRLTRADGSVWRYMPLVVGEQVRHSYTVRSWRRGVGDLHLKGDWRASRSGTVRASSSKGPSWRDPALREVGRPSRTSLATCSRARAW